ncbi:MAG: PD-(D/E)XK nuclease family protein [Ilumatobacteraceae bacterium]
MSDITSTSVRLTPTQESTLSVLRRGSEALVFSAEFVQELRDEANTAFAHFADRVDDNTIFVTKHVLAGVFGCETQFMAPDEFAWTPALARGQVSHRAIQLLINWRGEPTPAELVDDAIARLINEERGLASWLEGLGEGDLADLRAMATDHVTKFMECFPPLDPRSRPVTESSTQWPLDGPILLRGRSDLTIGKPFERESRKLIVDLKTGRVISRHREDLRFYALVETLSRQVPPRMLASFYLDAAEPVVEDVTENMLRSTLRRTLDGIHALIELQVEGRPPTKNAGAPCRWCTLSADCTDGQTYLHGNDADREIDGPD